MGTIKPVEDCGLRLSAKTLAAQVGIADCRFHVKIASFVQVVLLVLALTGLAFGETEHDTIARNFLAFLGSDKTIQSSIALESNALEPSKPPILIAYLVNLQNSGYILISASKSLTPVKAYSLNTPFETLPEAYRKFLLSELEYNIRALQTSLKTPLDNAVYENQSRWNFLLNFQQGITPFATYIPGNYLITTKWNQGYPYNKFLPEKNGQKVLAGCVNIAVGQVMKYWSYPANGKGVASFAWNDQQLKTILYRNYNWDNMPDSLDPATPDYKVDEVALLIRDLGIANHTNFNVNNSSTLFSTDRLVENFSFSNTITKKSNAETDFLNTLKNEIYAMRPVLIEFPGHLAVADGYADADPTGQKIHVNMGWGGHYDDFFYLDRIVSPNPSNPDNPKFDPALTFNIYYNVIPCNSSRNDCYVNLESGDTLTGSTINGLFNTEKDTDKYTVYLKGNTSISGSRGYYYVDFFISIYNNSDISNPVYSIDPDNSIAGSQMSVGSLPAGKYTIRISLCNDTCTSWYNDDNFKQYSVSFNTENLSDSEKASIDSTLAIGPVIFNDFKDIVLNSTSQESYKILIDARDENGEMIALSVTSTNTTAVQASISKNVLSLTPAAGASKVASKITVSATAGKSVDKSFIVMVLDEDITFGKNFTVSGTFKNQIDFNVHKVVLDGSCTITGGIDGYSGQPFFTSVKGSSGNTIVAAQNSTIDKSFPGSIYSLGVSLQQNPGGSGGSYDYAQLINHNYLITVNCPSANDTTETISGMLGVDLNSTAASAKIELFAGWNFISFPKDPSPNNTIVEVLKEVSSNVRVVWGYNNQSKVWLKYSLKTKNLALNTLDKVESSKGYWIYMDASGTIGTENWETPSATTTTLYSGWNLVGYNGTSDITNLPANYVIIWNWENGVWKAKSANTSLEPHVLPLDALSPGRAYWIKVNTAIEWQQ